MFGRYGSAPCCQPHEILFSISTVIDNLCGSMSVGGKVHLVLNSLEELLGNGGARIIVYAEGVNLQHLAVEHLLRTADVSDAG